ncbi:MAG TPA: zinc ribbon domain-containing protein [Anaerolineae bacterium]|nr:zinc ribbon domain-containing protein [Anaerolineae bacterium]
MSQKTLGYVNLEWTCKRCGSKNAGANKTCASCGNAMSEQDQFELPAQSELIADAQALAKTGRGADMHCPYCGARNPIGAQKCTQCAAELSGATQRAQGRVVGAFEPGAAAEVNCPACGTANAASANKCKQCGSALSVTTRAAAPSTPTATPARSSDSRLIGILALAAVAVFIFLLTRTTDTSARVEAVSWERSIEIVELRPVAREDWADLIPSDARKDQCTEKVRRTQAAPAPNAEQVCGTPYTVDQGDGTGKVVQDCQYNVLEQWCSYTRDEWTAVDAVVAQGNDVQPRWPELALVSGQREGGRAEQYEVVFNADGKSYTYSVDSADAFAKFAPGSRWTLKVNGLGAVTEAQPVN